MTDDDQVAESREGRLILPAGMTPRQALHLAHLMRLLAEGHWARLAGIASNLNDASAGPMKGPAGEVLADLAHALEAWAVRLSPAPLAATDTRTPLEHQAGTA